MNPLGRSIVASALALLGALALAAPAVAAPANDNIAGAQVLSSALPVSVAGTTVGATGESGEKVFGNSATESVWFSWASTINATVVVDLCAGFSGGNSAASGIGVYTGGTTFASLTKVADTAGPCKLRFAATSGTVYKIQVDYLHAQGTFTLALHLPQPPANDNFASAQALPGSLPVSVAGSTIEATFQTGEPGALGGSEGSRSVWYSWTPTATGHVQLGVCPFDTQPGSAANTAAGVYTGTTLATLTKVVETNNCTVEFDASAGTNYKIAFSGNFSGEGTFTLALRSATPPANDNLAAATPIGPGLPLSAHGDNDFATVETGESALPIGGLTGSSHSVWFQWTPNVSERVKLNACQAEEPRLGVFTGSTIATLAVATEPQSEAPFCAVELNAVAGTAYKIAIAGDSANNGVGPFDLGIHKVSRPANDNFAAPTSIGPDLPIAVDGNNTDATVETGEPNPTQERGPFATVWYRWESHLSGPVDISTCGSATNDFASVRVGSTLTATTRVAPSGEEEPSLCADQSQNGARERFTAVAGTTYLIQVSGVSRGFEGSFHLTITDPNAKPPTQPTQPTVKKALTLKQAIARCRTQFHGKGRKARGKRARCIVRVKRKFALARCHQMANHSQQQKCLAAVHRRYGRVSG